MPEPKWIPPAPDISLMGCCSYEDTWEPGITGWGKDDTESRANGYVSVPQYDELAALTTELYDALEAVEEATKNQDDFIAAVCGIRALVSSALAKARSEQ